jgi:ElaB/YqjD/DUF883 family membrane-anchored ribosome-binding protein
MLTVPHADAATTADTARRPGEPMPATRSGETGADLMDRLRVAIDGVETRARTQVSHGARRTDEVLHAHPYMAMGASAFVGLLIGLLVTRR